MAWDVADREDSAIAADLVSRACLRERISKSRQQPLILHADNGNAMRAATLESRLEELGVLRSFSRETLENPAYLRENEPVTACQDWVDGRQAAWLLGLRADHGQAVDQT